MEIIYKIFLDNIYHEIGYTGPAHCTIQNIKDFIEVIKKRGCTHILLFDHLFQNDEYEVMPINFFFVQVEKNDRPGSEYLPIDSDFSKAFIAIFLKSNTVYFRNELALYKDFE